MAEKSFHYINVHSFYYINILSAQFMEKVSFDPSNKLTLFTVAEFASEKCKHKNDKLG